VIARLDTQVPPEPDFRRIFSAIEKSVVESISRSGERAVQSSAAYDIDRAVDSAVRGHGYSANVGQKIADLLRTTFRAIRPSYFGSNYDFEQEMQKVAKQGELPGGGKIFHRTNELMVRLLADIVWINEPERVRYLTPILTRPDNEAIVIATLNYDNAVEAAARLCNLGIDTGIGEWSSSGQFPINQTGISLLKLHGSIDWALRNATPSPESPMPHSQIETASEDEVKQMSFRPALIFGGKNKLTAAGPFLDLLRAFSAALNSCERLTVIGYSFRDEHINEYIRQWINANPRATIRIINGPTFDASESQFSARLAHYLNNRIEIIKTYASDGIRQCFDNPESIAN
jgi:hypothetical protein